MSVPLEFWQQFDFRVDEWQSHNGDELVVTNEADSFGNQTIWLHCLTCDVDVVKIAEKVE